MIEKVMTLKQTHRHRKWGSITATGYRRIKFGGDGGKQILEHRLVWELYNGVSVPKGYEIHHVNENKLDNRIENLQLVDRFTHRKLTAGWRLVDGQWEKPCASCKEYKLVTPEFYHIKKTGSPHHMCKPCRITSVDEQRRTRVAR